MRDGGGSLTQINCIDEYTLQLIKDGNVDFVLVHNYILADKEILLHMIESGVPIILAVRYLFPEGEKEAYKAFHDQLEAAGAHLISSFGRLEDGLQKVFALFHGDAYLPD